MSDETLLYEELASWWPLMSSPDEYAEEAAVYLELLRTHSERPPESLLELGSGGGNNASHLKRSFREVTLVDRAPGMIDVSRKLNPECEHVVGDMYSVRLGRTFDCVFVHDALCYATSPEQLAAVLTTVWVHCRPGGTALFAPDFVLETYRPGTEHGGHDGRERGLRYLAWSHDPDPSDGTYLVDYAFLLRDGTSVTSRHDRHREGLFPERLWMDTLRETGFEARAVRHRLSDVAWESPAFVCVRPSA